MIETKNQKKGMLHRADHFLRRLDAMPLWWIGICLIIITFFPYVILREGSIFNIHDQLDETILSYVLSARHLFDGADIFPEMMGGIHRGGLQPSAVLFIFLYRILPPFYAFLTQYLVVFASAFFGMYGSVKKLTDSSILSVAAAGCFCMLPTPPVYGLSTLGVPLLLYAFLCLNERKHLVRGYLLVLFFGLTTHLVLIGYVVLGIWALAILVRLVQRKHNRHVYYGFGLLLGTYILINYNLFYELFLGNGGYISHREEMINSALPFFQTVRDVFLNSAQHAESLHQWLILPIAVLLAAEGIYIILKQRRKKLKKEELRSYLVALGGAAMLLGIALIYAFCKSQPVVDFKNSVAGFLHYFQAERFNWLYPALWYLELGLVFGVLWHMGGIRVWKMAALLVIMLPTLKLIMTSSYFYMNVNQINNGSAVTGYISWESFYAEELMDQLETAIGRDMSEYRIGNVGINPAPALMHGFYTIDGYSNNYSLEYKHRFRQIIGAELEKNEWAKVYFDTWGSRCYLYNAVTGAYWMLEKNSGLQYENLEYDMEALKNLGCEYLFSAAEIVDAEDMGLELIGYYETESSYWGIWLYAVL